MNLRSVFKNAVIKTVTATMGIGLALSSTGCSRDHIEAINLANEADRSVSVNVEGAIQKYEEATRLDPTNHLILWKLAKAYHKREDWDQMASTLARAAQVAPEFANYWEKRGLALTKLAESGNQDKWEESKEPLKKCIEVDPNRAWCYQLLGEAHWWTDDEQAALQYFTQAIETLRRVAESQKESLSAAADLLVGTIAGGRGIYSFGASHSFMLTEELVYRTGGLMVINPIYPHGMNLSVRPVTLTSRLERLPDLRMVPAQRMTYLPCLINRALQHLYVAWEASSQGD
jgi:tetratricopeptide (TPR) repeat protein